MYGKKECGITYEQGKLAIYTPYNADFVTEIKKIDGAKWNGSCWMVNKEYLEQVQEIVKSIYDDVDVELQKTVEIIFYEDVSTYFIYYDKADKRYDILNIVPFFDCKKQKFFDNIAFTGGIYFSYKCDTRNYKLGYNVCEGAGLTIKAGSRMRVTVGQSKVERIVERFNSNLHKEKVKVTIIDDESEE